MLKKHLTIEYALYTLAFVLALGIRFLNLGVAPLSDHEATWALQALDIARGNPLNFGPQPGYIFLTGGLFSLLGDSNFLARALPALSGSLLVLTPFLFRRLIGRETAFIIAFGVSLDPGLVAISRLIGSPIMAMAFGLLTIGFIYNRKYLWAGILGGVSLLSGPGILLGGVGLTLAWVLVRWFKLNQKSELDPDDQESGDLRYRVNQSYRIALISGVATVLIVGTWFSQYTQGLGAWAATLPAFLEGFWQASGIPASRLLAALVFYQPVAIIFGLLAIVRGWRDEQPIFRGFTIWSLIAILIPLLYPGRWVADIAWALIPLWVLAAFELSYSSRRWNWKWGTWIFIGLIWVLGALIWLNFAGLNLSLGQVELIRARLLVIGGAVLLGMLSTLLVTLGWSWPVARSGLVVGVGSILSLYVLANTFWVSQVRPGRIQEFWTYPPETRQADLLIETLGDLAELENGRRDYIEIISLVNIPSLRWALRNFSDVDYQSVLIPDNVSPVVITWADESSFNRIDTYRGQDFLWWVSPDWSAGLPVDLPQWIVFRDAPQKKSYLILWGRADLFPEGTLNLQDNSIPVDVDEGDPVE